MSMDIRKFNEMRRKARLQAWNTAEAFAKTLVDQGMIETLADFINEKMPDNKGARATLKEALLSEFADIIMDAFALADGQSEDSGEYCDICGETQCNCADRILLVDGAAGAYVPQEFINGFSSAGWLFIDNEDKRILEAGPEHELYWEAWEEACNNARFTDKDGRTWMLHHDQDLWAVPCEDEAAVEDDNKE